MLFLWIVYLNRDGYVLKDRDLSGELKDIWGAVQAKRLREKDSAPSYESYLASQNQVYIDFGPADAPPYQQEPTSNQQQPQQQLAPTTKSSKDSKNSQSISVLNVDEVDNNVLQQAIDNHQNNLINVLDNNAHNRSTSQLHSNKESKQSTKVTSPTVTNTITQSSQPPPPPSSLLTSPPPPPPPSSNDTDSNKNDRQATKREKLSGFLPNSCHNIFPFIKTKSSGHDKNGAHKEKNDSNQKDINVNQQQQQPPSQQQQQQQQNSNNITRKILYNGKDNNKLIQNTDTANLESEISKLEIGKI